jgi:hypothetical protein
MLSFVETINISTFLPRIYRVIQSSDAVLKEVVVEIRWSIKRNFVSDSPPLRSYDVLYVDVSLHYCK